MREQRPEGRGGSTSSGSSVGPVYGDGTLRGACWAQPRRDEKPCGLEGLAAALADLQYGPRRLELQP